MNTCAPASKAATAKSAWVSGQVLIETTSGPKRRKRLVIVGIARQVSPVRGQVGPLVHAAGTKPDDAEVVDRVIGATVRQTHMAETD